MNLGQQVRVRASGREGVIMEVLGDGRYRVEFYPMAGTKPVDPRSIERDDAGGIFIADELEPL